MNMKNALMLAAIVEAGTGLAMLIVPVFVWQLIFGEQLTGVGIPVARVGAMALIGLGIACWPGPPLVAMLTYGALATLYVAYMGTVHPPILVAVVGALGTTAGSIAQYLIVRWLLGRGRSLPHALERLRTRLTQTVRATHAATFGALFVVYATPLSAGPLRLIAAAAGFPLRHGSLVEFDTVFRRNRPASGKH